MIGQVDCTVKTSIILYPDLNHSNTIHFHCTVDTFKRCIRLQKGTAPINGCHKMAATLLIWRSALNNQSINQQKEHVLFV